jgi:hypothetical protein
MKAHQRAFGKHRFAIVSCVISWVLLPLVIAGCAAMIDSSPVSYTPVTATTEARLRGNVEIKLSPPYKRTLADGSRWRLVGKVPQGNVYKPLDAPFSIEGRQVHEAYLVIAAGSLVGFYLPAEGGYSPLSGAIPINIGDSQ